jgi:hypothetical protein
MERLIVFFLLSIVISCQNKDTFPPHVTILKPPDGSVFFVGDTVEIAARVVDMDRESGKDEISIILK